jgi:O-antigen/teichoic acid export membrane protein
MNRLIAWLVILLRRAESVTQTDNVYLAKNSFYLLIMQGVGVLNGFILYILIAHFLPKEVYGEYKYFISLFGLFAVCAFTGIDGALMRSVAQGFEGSLRTAFRRKLIGGLVGSALMIAAGFYYQFQGRGDLALPIFLIAVFAPWIYSSTVYASFLNGRKRFGLMTRLSIITSLVYFACMAVAVIFFRNSLFIFAAFLLANLANLAVYLYVRTKQANTKVDKDLLPFGTHLSLLDILGIVANSIDGVLIFHFLGAASLAMYSLAVIPVEQMKGFLKSVQSVAMPKFAVSNLATLRQTMRRKILVFMLLIAGLMGIYILLAPPFFALFFPKYLASVPYSQLYSLSIIFAAPASVLMSLFQAKGLRKEITLSNVLNYSIQIAMLVFGSWLYGLWGAIVARLIARALMLGTTHWMLQRADTGNELLSKTLAT